MELHLKSPDITLVKRGALRQQADDETELLRTKRFKRDTPQEPELQRVKRTKRDAAEGELVRVKRTKRTTDEQEPVLQRVKRADFDEGNRNKRDANSEEPALQRTKRFKRAVHTSKLSERETIRIKRAGKSKKSEAYNFAPLKRSKRAGLAKAGEVAKHVKNTRLREKRRQPFEELNVQRSHHNMDDIVKKAVEKLKRSKRHPKHSKAINLHRAKRGSLKADRSEVLKDITRDITRLQRLRRGIAHEVIRDVKRQTKAKNHHIIKRRESAKPIHNDMKKHRKFSP